MELNRVDLFEVILPVIFIFAIGFIGQKMIGFNIKTLSTAALYLLSPFLAFRTFYTNGLTLDYLYIFVFCCLLSGILFLIIWVLSFFMQASRSELSAMLLGGMFMNSGNYGVPVVLFAFGSIGFDYAVVMMVFQSLLMNSVGIFIASIGGKEQATIQDSVKRVVRMPLLHAAILGLSFQIFNLSVPQSMMNGVNLIADASIPLVMLVLGMQLAAISRKKVAYRYVTTVSIVRMFISPILAVAILFFLPLSDFLKSILIVQAAMPAAANTTMFALQFDTEPDLVSFTTFVTTIISLITIPIVLSFVGMP